MRAAELVGRRFGRLTVVARVERPPYHTNTCRWWLCRCDCGREVVCPSNVLLRGTTQSCGCLRNERSGERMRALNAQYWKAWREEHGS